MLIELFVTKVTVGGLLGFQGIYAAITLISAVIGPSPTAFIAETLKLYVTAAVKLY